MRSIWTNFEPRDKHEDASSEVRPEWLLRIFEGELHMSWNYRIVKYHNPEPMQATHGLHEVYYDEDDVAWGMTESPARFEAGRA